MKYDFDKPTNRRGTMSVKWDETEDPRELPLWVADMDFETAPAITDAILRRAKSGIFGYVHPSEEYYHAITDWFNRRHGWNIHRDSVIYVPGVVPAISAIIKALVKPGQGVIIQTPVYNCFFSSIANNGCLTIENSLLRQGNTYVMDYEDLERCCADPNNKMLLLCNPHNPAGRVWTRAELERVAEIAGRHDVVVVSDEIHCELVFDKAGYVPFATVSTKPCVSCVSPSKAFNTAGLHTANIVAPDPEMRALIDRAVNINEVCDIGVFGPVALIAAYNHGEDWLDQLLVYIHANYEYLRERVNVINQVLARKGVSPLNVLRLEGTYLAWVDVSTLGLPVEALCERLRKEAHVRFTPGTAYGSDGEGYIRVNLATQKATLAEAMNRLENFIAAL